MYKPSFELVVPSFHHLIPQVQDWVIPKPRVTIDQVNICPLATLKALGFTEYDLMLTTERAIKFCGITYKILGILDFVFSFESYYNNNEFLVIDLPADYDLLFREPWFEELLDSPTCLTPKGSSYKDPSIKQTLALRQGRDESINEYYYKWMTSAR
ncbi:hypothetical protein SOVF_013090 [Spinacia oleracea]|nr:hypothetical protein SOVF_013090 [Spinacia oleracea]